ncbi:MAG TPA: peptidoglycan DD-metalloendopeptidase family protein [Woeseiaceae bacterium]|nr:peptidoglycan DD-metalloendopeptidase family protein [Woeseiaceae bacterium]
MTPPGRPFAVGLLIALLLLAGSPAAARDESPGKIKEQELEEVREKISELKLRMDETAKDRDRLTAELQAAEVTIAEKRAKLAALERERAAADERRGELDGRISAEEGALEAESRELSAQLKAAYMSGSQERLKLLLNQQDPATLGRLMAYYGYLNDYRSDNIDTVTARLRELAALREEIAAEEARLQRIAAEREAELERLDGAQAERQALLARLREQLSAEGRELERLAAEEKELARLIAELTSILSDYPITSEVPFADFKGRLTWPVAGSLLHDFGQPRVDGKLKWNGVVLGAPRGREVRVVYHGRVVFADWLAGMGLLVIVDHGDGYLSLYGYNESILKNPGDWVAPGDAIATVGDSGGQAQSALYFEIRKGRTPVDPRQWVTRRPGR